MWHYHNKTHDPIPEGTICDHGCGMPALFFNTNGKYSCQKITQHCSEYRKKNATLVKRQWADPKSIDRKLTTGKSIKVRLHNEETIEKQKNTRRIKSGLLTPEMAKNFRSYARAIRQRAQKWAADQGLVLGKQTLHVDHKFSILDSWNANLPMAIVNHPANLQLLGAKENSSKGSKSSITLAQLYEMIREVV